MHGILKQFESAALLLERKFCRRLGLLKAAAVVISINGLGGSARNSTEGIPYRISAVWDRLIAAGRMVEDVADGDEVQLAAKVFVGGVDADGAAVAGGAGVDIDAVDGANLSRVF